MTALNAKVERSELQDGTAVWVGSVAELPGVFSQGNTPEVAMDELIALITNMQDRLGEPVVGVNTPNVGGWLWYMHPVRQDDRDSLFHGSVAPQFQPGSEYPSEGRFSGASA